MIVWKNGFFHSLENETKTYHKVITDQGVIVGFDDEINVDDARVVDLNGAHVYPGFVDSHIHLLGYGQKLTRPSLQHMNRASDMLRIIETHQEVVIFEGYIGNVLTFAILNELRPDKPLVLRHRDYHAATVNQYVLHELNIHSDDGLLKEEAATKAMTFYGNTTGEQLEGIFEKALKKLYAFGVTGGHSDDLAYFSSGFKGTLSAMDHVLNRMPFRAHLLMHHHVLDDYLKSNLAFLDQHDYLQLGAIKIFYDGTFGSHTALVSTPYVDDTYGIRVFEQKVFEQLLIRIRQHHLPIAVHVIGDKGLSELFDLIEKYPAPNGRHDRIIHASMWQDKDYERAKKLALIFDIQPQFVSSDIPEMLDVFKSKPQTLYPFRNLIDHKLITCGGSDAPVEIPNPLYGMYDAIYRETSIGVYDKTQCLSRYEALKLYTIYANIPSYKKNRGLLKKGFVADFTVLKEDVLKIPKTKFKQNKVVMTVINEHIVYES